MNIKSIRAVLLFLLCSNHFYTKTNFSFASLFSQKKADMNFGGWSISLDLYEYILNTIPIGKSILELGSGYGTQALSKYYKMHSIEHNSKWLNKFNSSYIYAPIINYGSYRWYDASILKKKLNFDYSLILVDGPNGDIGRCGFFYNHNLFDTKVKIIFDDVQRSEELQMVKDFALKFGVKYEIIKCSEGKSFAVVN